VPASVFIPRPRVESALVRIERQAEPTVPGDGAALFALARQAFSQRRKMLRRVLADWAAQVPWEALDIAPTARAEDISVDRYMRLSDALVEAGVLARD
jgi:16S rRNA (adenine1518-N6/adenine1519-N6)-dimethyltransferase